MIEHKILSQEDLDKYPHRGKTGPGRPWCKICSQVMQKIKDGRWGIQPLNQFRYIHKVIEVGEAVVKVVFRNGTVAYYHEKCWNNPNVAKWVEGIKSRSL